MQPNLLADTQRVRTTTPSATPTNPVAPEAYETPLPDESVSQATAPPAVSRVSTFTFDKSNDETSKAEPSIVSKARFPSSVVDNKSTKSKSVKEFSVISRSTDRLPQSRVRPVPENNDLETGIEYY